MRNNTADTHFMAGAILRIPGEGQGYPLQLWPGEFHGLYSSWGRKESDTTE